MPPSAPFSPAQCQGSPSLTSSFRVLVWVWKSGFTPPRKASAPSAVQALLLARPEIKAALLCQHPQAGQGFLINSSALGENLRLIQPAVSCHRSVSNLQSWADSSGHQPAHHEELGLLIARPMEALSGSPGESYFQDAQGQGEAAAKRSWRKLLILLMAFLESWEVFPKSGRVE